MTRPSENGFETVSDYLSALEKWFEADRQLGAAWRRCEAALPEGWWAVELIGGKGRYLANGYATESEEDQLAATFCSAGPTPSAALEALAAKLEAL